MLVGGLPMRSRSPLRAMLKHAASAAASSSSGFDPFASSNLVPNEYEAAIAPLSPSNLPVPPLRPPCHVALAVRVGIVLLLPLVLRVLVRRKTSTAVVRANPPA